MESTAKNDSAYGIYTGKGMEILAKVSVSAISETTGCLAYGLYAANGTITLKSSDMKVTAKTNNTSSAQAYGIYTNQRTVVYGKLTVDLDSPGWGIYVNSNSTLEPAIYLYGGDVTITGSAANGLFDISSKSDVAGIKIKYDSKFTMTETTGVGIASKNNNIEIADSTISINSGSTYSIMAKADNSKLTIENSDVTLVTSGDTAVRVGDSSGTAKIDLSTKGTVTAKANADTNYPISAEVTLGDKTDCVKGTYNEIWKKYQGEKEDGYTVVQFKHHETNRSAAVGDVTISGTVGSALSSAYDVSITLTDDTFNEIEANTDVKNWFTNLPSGLIAKIKENVAAGASTATITISGTPTEKSSALVAITIPAVYLASNTDLTVTNNANAKFAVIAKTKEETPNASFTATSDNGGTLSGVDATMKYSVDGGNTWLEITGNSMEITNVSADNDVQVKKPTTDADTKLDSDAQIIDVTKAEKPSGVSAEDCTTSENNDGKIKGLNSDLEYKTSEATTWSACSASEITGLTNGTYYVRVKASGTVLASDYISVTIKSYELVPAQIPNASFRANGRNSGTFSIANYASTMKYCVDGSNWQDVTSANMSITGVTVTNGIKLKDTGDGTTTSESAVLSISVTEGAKPTGLTFTSQVLDSEGKIETNNTHEYNTNGGDTYTTCGGALTGLKAGTYYIRVKASGTQLASETAEYTIIKKIEPFKIAHEITVTYTTGGKTASADKDKAYSGDTVTLKYEANDGYHFSKWTSDDVTINDDNTFTMPDKAVTIQAVFEENTTPTPPTHIHELVHKDKVEASCTENGTKEHYECTECGAMFEDKTESVPLTEEDIIIPAAGHKPSSTYSYDANNHWKVCTVCNEKLEKAAHSFNGSTCTTCNYTKKTYSSGGGGSSTGSSATSGNWLQDEKGWYFKPTYGTYPTNSWAKLPWNGIEYWYYFDTNGYMKTGWIEVGGKYYYLNPIVGTNSGIMLTGWQLIDGKWYYFSKEQGANEGMLLTDTVTPDNYKVGKDGVWIQ